MKNQGSQQTRKKDLFRKKTAQQLDAIITKYDSYMKNHERLIQKLEDQDANKNLIQAHKNAHDTLSSLIEQMKEKKEKFNKLSQSKPDDIDHQWRKENIRDPLSIDIRVYGSDIKDIRKVDKDESK